MGFWGETRRPKTPDWGRVGLSGGTGSIVTCRKCEAYGKFCIQSWESPIAIEMSSECGNGAHARQWSDSEGLPPTPKSILDCQDPWPAIEETRPQSWVNS